MGGSPDRVTVVPVVTGRGGTCHASEELRASGEFQEVSQFKTQLSQFAVERAHCARVEDTQRLLACVEVGFGSYREFAQLIRHTFDAQQLTFANSARLSASMPDSHPCPGTVAEAASRRSLGSVKV